MATMDAFNSSAFTMTSMLDPVNEMDYLPGFLEALGIFSDKPIMTENFNIESMGESLRLVPTTARGTAPSRNSTARRTAVSVSTTRIATGDTIRAAEIQNVRAFGQENELESVARVVAQRQQELLNDIALTWENMRYGAVNGVVLDADGSEIIDWYDAFDITRPSAHDFDLDNASPASGALYQKCQDVVRSVIRGMKMGATTPPQLRIIALCDDSFFDAIRKHPEFVATFTGHPAAQALRESNAFGSLSYGGIEFHNVRGTDDGSTVGVGTGEALFFPVMPGLFETAWSPGEFFDVANTMGRPLYPMIVPDRDRNAFVEVELYSYPLFICKRPRALQRATIS